jgi:hypothetical protein
MLERFIGLIHPMFSTTLLYIFIFHMRATICIYLFELLALIMLD